MRNQTLTALSIVGLASLISTHASAQNIERALQLGLGTNLITYSSASITQNVPAGNGTTIEYESVNRTTVWGLGSRNNVTFEGGYGITDSLVLGGMLELGGWSNTTGPDTITAGDPRRTDSMFSLFLGPKLDFMLLPDSVVRPFIGGAIGLVRQSYSIETTNQNNITEPQADFGVTGVGLLARAGIRWFLTPGFSIDPAFVFGFATASGSTGTPVGGGATRNDDTSATGYTLGLRVGFSGWIGL
jgi:opacity protein-like surface antigen